MNYKKKRHKKTSSINVIILLSSMVVSFLLCLGFYFKEYNYTPLITSFLIVFVLVVSFVIPRHKSSEKKYRDHYKKNYRKKSCFNNKDVVKKDSNALLFENDALFENDIIPMYISDKNHCIIKTNKAFEKETGYVSSDVIGKKYHALTSKINEDSVLNKLWESLEINGKWNGTLNDKRKCGKIYKKRSFIKRVNDHNGNPKRYISMFHKTD